MKDCVFFQGKINLVSRPHWILQAVWKWEINIQSVPEAIETQFLETFGIRQTESCGCCFPYYFRFALFPEVRVKRQWIKLPQRNRESNFTLLSSTISRYVTKTGVPASSSIYSDCKRRGKTNSWTRDIKYKLDSVKFWTGVDVYILILLSFAF